MQERARRVKMIQASIGLAKQKSLISQELVQTNIL
jgi:hypothetical protein